MASTSTGDTDQQPGEEILAEGLIPSDAGISTAEAPAAEPTAAEDPAAVSGGGEAAFTDIPEAAQSQVVQPVDPAEATMAGTAADAELDPNSTAALIQVFRAQSLHSHSCLSLLIQHACTSQIL